MMVNRGLSVHQVLRLSKQHPEDLAHIMASTNMLQLFLMCFDAENVSLFYSFIVLLCMIRMADI